MGRMFQDNVPYPDVEKITISTWVYLSKKATEAQLKAAQALSDDEKRAGGVFKGIPLIEFGNSIEPRTGIGIAMGMVYEGYLGFAYWTAGVGIPSPPDHLATVWIGAEDTARTGWFPYSGLNRALSSIEAPIDTMSVALFTFPGDPGLSSLWKDVELIVGGIASSTTCSFFYPKQIDPGPILHPEVNYNGFNDAGINGFNVTNGGMDFPKSQYSLELAVPSTWTFAGTLKLFDDNPRVSLKANDIAQQSIQVNTEVLFWQFYPDPKNFTIQPVPTTGPDLFNSIRVDAGGPSGKYFDFGQLVVLFPKRDKITYSTAAAKIATPSALYFDGNNVNFLLSGRWPEKTTTKDHELVPTLTFNGPGGLKLDSWNHIFLSIDLSTMVITGGNDDLTLTVIEPIFNFYIPAGIGLPAMTVPPKFTMIVNGGKPTTAAKPPVIDFPIQPDPGSSGNPTNKLTIYPSKDGHWKTDLRFKMQLNKGQVGFPIIPQEVGRYKVTGPNAEIEYAYTHIWFNKAIEATDENLAKFFKKNKIAEFNMIQPPIDKEAAVNEFGTPHIWCYRDKENDIRFQDNQGNGPDFTVVGQPDETTDPPRKQPVDFRPGPGQPKRVSLVSGDNGGAV